MTAILTRPAWITDLELEIFDKLLDKYAPHIPKKRCLRRATPTQEPRLSETDEDTASVWLVQPMTCLLCKSALRYPSSVTLRKLLPFLKSRAFVYEA